MRNLLILSCAAINLLGYFGENGGHWWQMFMAGALISWVVAEMAHKFDQGRND